MPQEQTHKQPTWRRWLAFAVLVGGLSWIISGFLQTREASFVELHIALARSLRPEDVEVWICIRDMQGEDVWTFRGQIQKPRQHFRPQVAKGEYELYTSVRMGERILAPAHSRLTVPGVAVHIEVSDVETRIIH